MRQCMRLLKGEEEEEQRRMKKATEGLLSAWIKATS